MQIHTLTRIIGMVSDHKPVPAGLHHKAILAFVIAGQTVQRDRQAEPSLSPWL
jgi:hypothetical protein